ncbi:P-loop containing nucleoside triphosphate hydrolase [Melia azedarach]|uniref:P-loop containing nucleoside triphosphate hydrolase n=1 Tax=Melia azedarach TaxID=155640 RepID=A0ACC1XIC9_MELAZ|nr:P-loop containing nucleoside triphosphate hydrolase [Melia azedarach]
MKANYVLVDQKGASPIYMIPKDIESLIKKDLVPDVLKKPLSPSTYKDYFAALLYAEDFYVEKWNDFQLRNVTLQLHEAAIYNKSAKNESAKKDDKIFVAFKIDSAPAKRPFLLSRDFVFVQRSDGKNKKFQGILYRVVKSTMVLVEFDEEFYAQHHPDRKYDISFSFNRVSLKRAHQAISAASSGLFKHYLFPENAIRNSISPFISGSAPCVYNNSQLDLNSNSAVHRILSFKGHPPYLVEGPLCVSSYCGLKNLSKTGRVVREAVLQIYQRSSSNCRILICSPLNSTGDILMRSLKKHKFPESVMFRANAAFREVDGVPDDILPLCAYEGECFSLPSLGELKQFRVIFSTFVSSFRLLNHGINAGHFSHIFLVDSSSATEPETMIPLSSFANENTSVILTGAPNDRTRWVRSDIARNNGLRISYFERLRASNIYSTSNPTFITQL